MKETKKITRILCISMIIINTLFLIITCIREAVYSNMIRSEVIYEKLLDKIFWMDQFADFLRYFFLLVCLAILLYFLYILRTSIFHSDCKMVFISMLLCLFSSYLLTWLRQASTFIITPQSSTILFFFLSLITIGFINQIKKKRMQWHATQEEVHSH